MYAGNRSDVLFVSRWDLYWNSSTSVARSVAGKEDSGITIVANAESLPNPIRNSLMFARDVQSERLVGFWLGYNWLCGNTNSFEISQESPGTWCAVGQARLALTSP
jgi:hypothetical protein